MGENDHSGAKAVGARGEELSQLRQERDRLLQYLDLAALVVVALDAEQRVTFINQQGCQLLGRAREEIVGSDWIDRFVVAEGKERTRRACEEVFAGRWADGTEFECQLLDAAGQRRTIAWRICALSAAGDGGGTLSSGEDVTERRANEADAQRLEEQLRHSQRMEAIGTLAGGIAHDFNNVLAAIMGYTELTLLKLEPASRLRGNLEEVMGAAERASEVVRQILAFSRKAEHGCSAVPMVPLLKEVLKLLRAAIPVTVEIREQIHPDCGEVWADPVQLHQMVMNLCTNAYRSLAEQRGAIAVTLQPVNKGGEELLELAVIDDGIGMDAVTRSRVFEPYFTTEQFGPGSGMGLAVVHGIVEGLGGDIVVDSEPGRGSCFRVYLPRLQRAPAQHPVEPQLVHGCGERVLFVDDEVQLAELGRSMLGLLGYRVVSAASGAEAIEYLQRDPAAVDCLVTDQIMPRQTGVELIVAARAIRPDLPALLCTGHDGRGQALIPPDLVVQGVLAKPLKLADLSQALATALNAPP